MMFCNHDWEKIVDDYTPSPLERTPVTNLENGSYELFQGTKIIILKCNKCGKLDKTIEKV